MIRDIRHLNTSQGLLDQQCSGLKESLAQLSKANELHLVRLSRLLEGFLRSSALRLLALACFEFGGSGHTGFSV